MFFLTGGVVNTTKRRSGSLRYLTAAVVTMMVVASCATSDPAADSATTDASTIAAPSSTESTARAVVTTEPNIDVTTTAEREESSTNDSLPEAVDDVLRLAPVADEASPLLLWDRSGIEVLGHSERLDRQEINNLIQVTAVPSFSPVFQTADNERVIWHVVNDGPEALLEVPANEALTLEGAGLDAAGESVFFYQHHVYADPENTRSTLRSYRLSDASVTEIAVTGGWESGVRFSHISRLGDGRTNTAVALWGAEGWTWLEITDVGTGDGVFNSQDLGMECFDGDEGCPNFWEAVVFDDDIIGMGPVIDDAGEGFGAFGLWRYETDDGTSELIEAWEWDNGLWYVEDMFLHNDSVLVISLEDGEGQPLPALFFDLVSGESWTEPDAGFLRPAFLS